MSTPLTGQRPVVLSVFLTFDASPAARCVSLNCPGRRQRFGRALLLATTLAALAVISPGPAIAQIANGVFVAGSTPYGKSYAEWSAAWWQWNFSLPMTSHPIQDTAPISTGQSGPVWFLGGTFGHAGNQTRVRSGSVPEGTALFIGIMESWADNANCPVPDNYTTTQLRSLAASAQNSAFGMSCTIDGVGTVDLNSTSYRVQSPVFSYMMPGVHNYAYDFFGATCYLNADGTPFTITGAVADGVYLMVAPLEPGTHTIHFLGSYQYHIYPFFTTYVQDITYNLTVVPTPMLSITHQGANCVLSWPQAASWVVLETSDTPGPLDWMPVGLSVQQVEDQYQVTVPLDRGTHFFRLRGN